MIKKNWSDNTSARLMLFWACWGCAIKSRGFPQISLAGELLDLRLCLLTCSLCSHAAVFLPSVLLILLGGGKSRSPRRAHFWQSYICSLESRHLSPRLVFHCSTQKHTSCASTYRNVRWGKWMGLGCWHQRCLTKINSLLAKSLKKEENSNSQDKHWTA